MRLTSPNQCEVDSISKILKNALGIGSTRARASIGILHSCHFFQKALLLSLTAQLSFTIVNIANIAASHSLFIYVLKCEWKKTSAPKAQGVSPQKGQNTGEHTEVISSFTGGHRDSLDPLNERQEPERQSARARCSTLSTAPWFVQSN